MRRTCVLLSTVFLVCGCSGTGEELFGGSTSGAGGAGPSGTGPSGTGGSGSASGAGGFAATGQGGASTTSASGTSTPTATTDTSSSTPTATTDVATTTTGTTATGGGANVDIPCGADTCMSGELCCVTPNNPSGSKCAPAGTMCGFGAIPVGCNNAADCAPNQICCGAYSDAQQQYLSVQCAASCDPGQSTWGIVMCEDDPGACGPGQDCNSSSKLPDGYSFCQ